MCSSLVFLGCFIGASLCLNSYSQPMWPSPGIPQQIGPYIVLVNNQPAGEAVIEEESLEQRMTSELERLRGSNFPSLQQYHHNENVNQYYGFPSSNKQNYPNNYMNQDSAYGGQINSRQKNRFRPSLGNTINQNQVISQDQQQRLLFGGYPGFFFPSVLYTLLSDFSTQLWSTTTTFFQYNSTLTTTVVTSCIPLNQFASVNSMFSTNSCRRKRDEASILIGEDIESSNPIEKKSFTYHDVIPVDRIKMSNNEVESSKEFDISYHHIPYFLRSRHGRNARYTVTLTFTNYSFYTVNSTRTVQLYSGANMVTCMPHGFRVC